MKLKTRPSPTLRTKLLILPITVILIMSLLCAALLIMEYHASIMLTQSLDMSKNYNLFESALNQFQSAFTLYANSLDRKYLNDYYAQLESMLQYAEAMSTDFPDEEAVIRNSELITQYVNDTDALIANSATIPISEFASSIAKAEQIHNQIRENAQEVQMLYLQNVVQHSDQSIELWRVQMRASIAFVVLVLIVLLIAVNRIIRSIAAPILHLVDYAKRISLGDFEYPFAVPEQSKGDEIYLLTKTFVRMAETIKIQMRELQDKIVLTERLHTLEKQNISIQLSLAEKEMALMQSMINPHFLFNCLGTVSSMAVLESAPRTQSIATKIARYLRSSIDLVGSQITLREEVDLLKQYTYIQSLRFGERISIDINCSPACEEALVPAMFLQPLVENAFVHGLHSCTQGGKIDILMLLRPDQRIGIRIADNGIGISPEKLHDLQTEIHNPFENGQPHVGLHSVISQFDIMFNDQYSFNIESELDHGTTILILLPFLTDKKPSN